MESQLPSLNDYQLERELGQSEDSTFYHGIEKKTRRKVLVRLLNPIYNTEPQIVQNFIEEAKTIRGMNFAGVIQLVDFGQEGGFFFTAYERPIVTLLDRLPQLSLSECIEVFQEIVKSLDYMHIQGYVHGHLTPGSIMFREDGSLAIMNLGTFIFQSYQTPFFDSGKVSPAAYYKSPEQCRNQGVDNRSDHYSLGAIFFHLLAKKPPYQAENTVDIIVKHIEAPPPQLAPEYARYQPLLDKMMAKDPSNRTQNGKEILEWLGSGSAASGGNGEALELDFSPDFEPTSRSPYSSGTSSSPYAQHKTRNSTFKYFIPALVLLCIAGYLLFMKYSKNADELAENPNVTRNQTLTKGQKKGVNENEAGQNKQNNEIVEIEMAIQQGELSLAEAKINSLIENNKNAGEINRLKELLIAKNLESKKEQFFAQLTIAEAALHSDDLASAEIALSNARKIMTGPELFRLESLLQQKMMAPEEQKNDSPVELVSDTAEDDRVFQRAKMGRSKERLHDYLKKFPNGRHKAEAETIVKSMDAPSIAIPSTTPPVQDIKRTVILNLSAQPAIFDEKKVIQILQFGDFFESRRNKSGKFDNPIKIVGIQGARAVYDIGLQRLWLIDSYGLSLNIDEAKKWVADLNERRVGGISDWRLPTLAEAVSLLRPKVSGGKLYAIQGVNLPDWIWSADQLDGNNNWAVFFSKGQVDGYRKTDRLDVMAVRTHSGQ